MAGQSPERRSATAPRPDVVPLLDAAELAPMLAELGLSANEARLYVALLRLGAGTAAELARAGGVLRPKVYEALGALENRGFCTTVLGHPTRYRPVAPDVALSDWTRHRDHERAALAERERTLSATLIRVLPAPAERAAAPQPPDYLEAVSGRAQTTQALEEIMARAQRSIWMMQQPPFLQARTRWNVAEVDAVRRGVQVRVIYTDDAARDRSRFADLLEAGGECRVRSEIPMKLLVRDGVEAFCSLRDARSGEQTITSVAMRHPDLARPLGLLFRQEWKTARPIGDA